MTKKAQPLTEEQLRAIVPARSREVLVAFQEHGPMTVPELQDQLDFPSKSAYYQVSKLVRAGILAEDGERGGSALFRPAISAVALPDGFQGEEYERLAAEHAAASLRRSIRSFRAAAAASPSDPGLVDWLTIVTSRLRLTPERNEELRRRLDELVREFREDDGPQTVDFVAAITPRL